ncbi:MAG: formylglycine-generating enzyme family protein [Planctomycetes bacterium]|nr:formylglycine-generating enzyme family protein [Planctomycetota bacterium]
MRAMAHGRAALALLGALAGNALAGAEAPKERVVHLGGGVKISRVLIPAGTFTMGSTEALIRAGLAKLPDTAEESFADEKPAHKVTISKAFWMGKHEVTVGQFRRFVEATGWCNAADLTAKKAFPDWAVFNWDDGSLYTAPVGSFKANAFGLHDTHGNAWEWCQDWHGPYKAGEQTDPKGPEAGVFRVIRGGCWIDGPGRLRSAHRGRNYPGFRADGFGFRVVLAPGH